MIVKIAHLSADRKPLQQKILSKHIFDIRINLTDGIYITHESILAIFPRMPFTNEAE